MVTLRKTRVTSRLEAPGATIRLTAMNFGSKNFQLRPRDQGSFPLDHFGDCKSFKEKFTKCLHENNLENVLCRNESKEYLDYRTKRQLMAQEQMEKLGFGDLIDRLSETKTNFRWKEGCWAVLGVI